MKDAKNPIVWNALPLKAAKDAWLVFIADELE